MLTRAIVPMESVSTFIFGCLPVPRGTGKHPNINVETQIPLELPKSLFTGIVPLYRYCPSMQGFAELIRTNGMGYVGVCVIN